MNAEMTTPNAGLEGLLTCPFCGSQPGIQHWHGGGPQKRLISCVSEDCTASPAVTGPTLRKAITAWNTRPLPGAEGDARDAAALRMWRNHFISERTAFFRESEGKGYEEARAHAESRANELEQILFDAMDRLEDKDTALASRRELGGVEK